jgi:hypothetical protein
MKDTQYDIIIETPDGTTIKRTMGFASMIDAMDFVEKKWPGRLSLKITKAQKIQNNFTNGPKKNYNKFVNKKNKKNIYTPGGANERRNRPTHN